MRISLLVLFLSLHAIVGYGQHSGITISGRIIDVKNNTPLDGASIYLEDAKSGTISNKDGYYKISNIPPGHHLIEVSYSGYATIVEHVDLTTDLEKNFQMTIQITEHEGVTVTGTSVPTLLKRLPVSVTVVRKADLLQSASTNIIDALSKKAGVSQVTTGPGVSKPVIRGLGYNRVVVVNDGVRQEGQQWGDEHGIEIDEQSISKAEILKGPASIMYGSDALAGVVNFTSSTNVADRSIKGNLYTNFQSNNDLYALNGNVAGSSNGFNWSAYGTYKSAEDYRNKRDGRVLNSRFNEKNFGAYLGLNKSWGYSHLIVSNFNQQLGVIEGDRDIASGRFLLYAGTTLERVATEEDLSGREPLIPHQSIDHFKLVSDNSFNMGKGRLKVNIAWQKNLRKEFGNPENPSEENLSFDLQTLNYNFQWQLAERKEWKTTIGLNGMYQQNRNKGSEVLIPEYDLFDAGLFVYSQKTFKQLTLSGGLRFDNRTINSKEFYEGADRKFIKFNKDFANFSASAGLSYEVNKFVILKLNMARAFRSPNVPELSSNGAHEGTNRYEYGNRDLKPETSLQFDGGIEINNEHFNFSLNTFFNSINDYIYYRKLEAVAGGDSTMIVDGSTVTAFQFQQNNAYLYGAELFLDIHPHPLDWLHFENTFSFVRGKSVQSLDGTNDLALIPAPKLLSELKANFPKIGKWLRNFYCSAEADFTFAQNHPFTAYNTETATDSYTLFNVALGGDITNKNGKTVFSLYLLGANLLDEVYQNHLSRLKYTAYNFVTGKTGVFNAGRNFSVKLNIPFEFSSKKRS